MNRTGLRNRLGVGLLMLFAGPALVHANEYFVATGGSDAAAGTRAQPFKTIQRAAQQAKPGDVCVIAPGVYRETVTPKHSGTQESPIIFRALTSGEDVNGGRVTVAGTDPVRRWERHAGHIHKATMTWSLGKNNQIFFDGKPLQEARWPNDKDGDPMTPDGAPIGGGDVDHISCAEFPADWQADTLKDAVVWAIPHKAWSSWTAPVSGFDPGAKQVLFPSFKGVWWVEANHNPRSAKGEFYLVGALHLLDAPGEWFHDEATQTLYLWAPDNADPNEHRVEAKSRTVGVNLKNRSWIVVDGVDLLGCSLTLERARHCLVKGMKAHHIFHTRGGKTMSSLNETSGIDISGAQNRLVNCEIAHSAGNGVMLGGTDNAVINCWIHHIDSSGSYCAPVFLSGLRHLISHNTIAHTGRDCIKLEGAEHLIQFNDIGYAGRICHDLGMIYSGGLDGGNTRIRHNFVHDNPGGPANVGIYLDNYMKNYIVDHNVIWNVGNGIRLNRPTGFCMVLNNTVFKDINNSYGPWDGQKVQWGCHVMNNLCAGPITMNPEVVMRGNLPLVDVTGCFDTRSRTWGSLNPGEGQGVPVAGITPGERVDVGARQHNAPPWRAGHDFQQSPEPAYASPDDEPLRNCVRNAAFEYSSYYRRTDEQASPLVHWTKTHAATARVEFHQGFNDPPANERHAIHGNSVRLGGDAADGIQQELIGLLPNTTYCFSGYAQHGAGVGVEFAVRQAGQVMAQASSQAVTLDKGQTWRFVHVRFTTGPADTSATISIVKQGSGEAFVDDTGVVPVSYGLPE